MSAPEAETARLLAPEDDAETSWRTKSASWRTIGAGVTVRAGPRTTPESNDISELSL
jgi:hypothetical protein